MTMILQKRNYQDGIKMINNYQSKLTDIYLKIQEEEQKSLRHRKEEIQKFIDAFAKTSKAYVNKPSPAKIAVASSNCL